MKITAVFATVGLSLLSSGDAFTAVTQGARATSLNAGNVQYSTQSMGPGTYEVVTDPAEYAYAYHTRDQSGVAHYGYRKEEHVPGTTGGPGGSTLVSDYIMKDSVYGPNYHYVQRYRRQRSSAPPARGGGPSYGTKQLRQPWNKQAPAAAPMPRVKQAAQVQAK